MSTSVYKLLPAVLMQYTGDLISLRVWLKSFGTGYGVDVQDGAPCIRRLGNQWGFSVESGGPPINVGDYVSVSLSGVTVITAAHFNAFADVVANTVRSK